MKQNLQKQRDLIEAQIDSTKAQTDLSKAQTKTENALRENRVKLTGAQATEILSMAGLNDVVFTNGEKVESTRRFFGCSILTMHLTVPNLPSVSSVSY